jgi:hypothetical protein
VVGREEQLFFEKELARSEMVVVVLVMIGIKIKCVMSAMFCSRSQQHLASTQFNVGFNSHLASMFYVQM